MRSGNNRNYLVVVSLLGLIGAAVYFPIYYTLHAPKPSLSGKALSSDAIRRGPYTNSGSRDIGPDPRYR